MATVDDGTSYTITGRVPVLLNGVRSELILVFDSDHPTGFVAGARTVYPDGETGTVAKTNPATGWSSCAIITVTMGPTRTAICWGSPSP